MISFVRIDDRMIHGQTVTRWAVEYPCDGIIAVNDAAASNSVLKSAYKSAAPDKKTFVWTMDHFKEKADAVLSSKSRYFLITKNPLDMAEILVDFGFVPDDVKTVIVGKAGQQPVHHTGGSRCAGAHFQGGLCGRFPPHSRQGHRLVG